MPVAIADGILGLEAVHTWTPAVGPPIALNNLELTPRYRFERITGLHDLPDSEDHRTNRTGAIGELVHPSGVRGKTVVYEGVIQARDSQEMRRLSQDLRYAMSERNLEGSMTAIPHAGYGSEYFSYSARVQSLKIDEDWIVTNENHPRTAFQRGFILTVRQSDPRYYLPAHAVSVGSDSGSVSVSNIGNAHVDPVITVGGGFGTVAIGRTGGPVLVLDMPTDGVHMVKFDFWARTVTTDGGARDLSAYLNVSNSNWWDALVQGIPPGAWTVNETGGTYLTVEFTPASW